MGASFDVGALVDGKYRILRLIGEGGWGIVFEGENARTLKRVAIKVLHTQSAIRPDIQGRFEREAQAAGRIGSEHIVEVFDLGTLPDGSCYMVMELLSGEDLATRVRRAGRLPPVVAVKLVIQLLDGLEAAHAAGILHRDLKPENLFLVPTRTGEDFVKILDFGISKFTSAPASSATMTGAVLGTPFYMAPEQARGMKQVDVRADVYAVGTVLFQCLTGQVPFAGDNFNELMFKIVLAPRPNPIDLVPDLDPDLGPLVVKAIKVDPAERFQTAEEFRAALVAWLDSQGVASVRAPELRRAVNLTPATRSNPDVAAPRPGGITPVRGAAKRAQPAGPSSGQSAEQPGSETGKETPVASSSTIGPRRRGRRALVFSAALAAVVLAFVGALSWKGLQARRASTGESAPPHPAAALEEPGPSPVATTEVLAAPVSREPFGPPLADAAAVTEPALPLAPRKQVPLSHGGTRGTQAPRGLKDAPASPPALAEGGPKPSAAVAIPSAPAPATAPAPPAPSSKPATSVEGRGIRTNL